MGGDKYAASIRSTAHFRHKMHSSISTPNCSEEHLTEASPQSQQFPPAHLVAVPEGFSRLLFRLNSNYKLGVYVVSVTNELQGKRKPKEWHR
uniref:Uncharacterized protein n=1 Tax=Anopheles albimanus TaxID=7167 RepID=A0A182FXS5_ANOAL